MTRMRNPPHPGEVLADTVLREDGGLTVSDFAKRLGVSRVALSRVFVTSSEQCACAPWSTATQRQSQYSRQRAGQCADAATSCR